MGLKASVMKVQFEQIKKIAEDAQVEGLNVRVRDVAFYVLEKVFEDKAVAYRTIFDNTADDSKIEEYAGCAIRAFIQKWFKKNAKTVGDYASVLTFEENRQALIDMLEEIDDAVSNNKLKKGEALKMKADIRVKLQDKFGVGDEQEVTIVMVEPKYNKICPRFNVECYEQTREYAMKQFHLIPDPNYHPEDEEAKTSE